ncbi:MAG: geranylgeranyl reductase family protein [Leptolyngbyaceae cyanobacterium]
MLFDCIVVGAGPAGASAAYHLAKRGHSVVILEKATLPRYKPCSGGVSPAIAQWFDFDFTPAIALKVNSIRYTWKLSDPVDANLTTNEPMWMVRRDVFDHFLVQKAQEQGATLQDNREATGIEFKTDHWQVNTVTGPVTGRYLIAADGAKGPMAQWLGFKTPKMRMGASLEAPSEAVDAGNARFEFGMVKNGYIWHFPKPNGYSLGIATFRGGEPNNVSTMLTDYARQAGINLNLAQQFIHPVSLWDGNQKLHTQQALLVGDAASVADPFTAEGIRPSIFTGVKAAEAIDAALAGNPAALETYSRVINDEWGTDMQWAQRLAGVFYRVPGIGYKVGVKRPAATERIGQILCGELRYADVANAALKKLGGSLIPGMG